MKRNVFAATCFGLWFGCLLCFLVVKTAESSETGCDPEGINQSETYQGCPNLLKKAKWTVVFPDAQFWVEPTGSGGCASGNVCCDETARTTECWPEFNPPVTSPGKWSLLVTNKSATTTATTCSNGCFNANVVSCVSSGNTTTKVEHTCQSTGGGCPDGQIPPECDPGQGIDFENCCCVAYSGGSCLSSPILVDILGNGFNLTNVAGGVTFDINATGNPINVSWTAVGSDDAWLVLDRDGNGRVDTGAELFGNHTLQATSTLAKNGFLALGDFDETQNGGNSDGMVTQSDAVFSSLRLWQDVNHNGISESSELRTLSDLGVAELDLDYKNSRKVDEYGNLFRYRAKIKDMHGAQVGRWAWDVFLMTGPLNSTPREP
jgi:hypothetical protein